MNKFTLFGLLLAGSILYCAYWLAGPETSPSSKKKVAGTPTFYDNRPNASSSGNLGSAKSSNTTQPRKPIEQASISPPAPPPPPPLTASLEPQGIIEAIRTSALTYNASELQRIEPYLSHSDPEVRKAAMNGIVELGYPPGATMLRDAATHAASPEEAALLREKADYLLLPTTYQLMKSKKLGLPLPSNPSTNLPQP
jgi:hypothetical protein